MARRKNKPAGTRKPPKAPPVTVNPCDPPDVSTESGGTPDPPPPPDPPG